MSTRTVRFVELLSVKFPPLMSILAEHREDNLNEILPHVFMADVARWAIELFVATENKNDERRSELLRLLELLEDAYEREGPEIVELVSASFLEHLPRPEEAGGRIRDLVGQRLKEQLQVIG